MKSVVESFQAYNRYGEKMSDVVLGTLFELRGQCLHCNNGLIIQLADIQPADGSPMRTIYLEVST